MEEALEESDFTPQNWRKNNVFIAQDKNVDLYPATPIKGYTYQDGTYTQDSIYSGEMMYRVKPAFTGIDKQINSQELEDDTLIVRSTLNGLPMVVEQPLTREEVKEELRVHCLRMMFDNVRRIVYADPGYQRMVQRRVGENEFPAWKTDWTIPMGTYSEGTQQENNQSIADAAAFRVNFLNPGIYTGAAVEEWGEKLAILLDDNRFDLAFSSSSWENGPSSLSDEYYLVKRPDVDLVGFSPTDHNARTYDDTMNPNFINPPTAITHGIKFNTNINDAPTEELKVVNVNDMVFSVYPRNPKGVIFPYDPKRLIRKIETTSFNNFLLEMSKRNANTFFASYRAFGSRAFANLPFGGCLPFQKRNSDGLYILGDVFAFLDPTIRLPPRQLVAVQNGFTAICTGPAQIDGVEVAATEVVGVDEAATWAEPPAYGIKDFIGEALSPAYTHGAKFLQNYALSF